MRCRRRYGWPEGYLHLSRHRWGNSKYVKIANSYKRKIIGKEGIKNMYETLTYLIKDLKVVIRTIQQALANVQTHI